MKPNHIARGPVRAEPQDESATPGPLQAVERRAAQSSAMPEGLRNLADKVTARKQTHAASNLTGRELLMAASNPNLNGRGARALQREIAHRRATNAPATTPPAPASRKSVLPNPMRGMLDTFTARTQTAQAAALSDAELADRLAGPAPQMQREARALQREAAKRQAQRSGTPPASEATGGDAPVDDTRMATDASSSIAAPAPSAVVLPAGPVIDIDSGALDLRHLEQTVTALAQALPELPVTGSATRLRERLANDLAGIGATAANINLRPDQRGLAVRDGFARAARTARVLARYLDRDHLNHGAGANGTTARECATSYFLIAGLMTELKRTHLSAAAPDLMAHYAEREVARLERVAPGIGQGVSGPNVATSTGASLEYSVGVGNVGGSASAGRTFFSDDDRDIDFWESYTVALQGGAGTRIANWAAKLNGQAAYAAGGTYFEHDDLRELVKLVANLDANRAWIRGAGPRTRKLVHGWEHVKDKVSQGVNRNYVQAPERPYFLNDTKLAKGFNGVKVAMLAMMLDEAQQARGGQPIFDAIVAQAYPAAGDVLRQRLAARQPLPPSTRRDVPDSVAYADRRVAFREATLAVDASLGRATSGNPNLGAGGNVDLLARGDLLQFFTETANAPHQILDPAHHKDPKATLAIHQQLDASYPGAPPPALRLYDLMRGRLQGAAGPLPPLDASVAALYGEAASIPAQFRNAIAHPSVQQLDRVAAEADGLKHLYLNFIENAATLLARSDRALPKPAREQLNTLRAEAFERVNAEVWHGGYARADALANPEKFVAASQASISLALGAVGTHLGIVKERLSHGDAEHTHAARQADRGYAEVRELLDRLYLPMKKHDVQKDGPLKEQALWQRWDVLVRGTASGGAQVNALGALLGHWQKSLGPVGIANDAGGLTLSAEAKFLYADHQINPSRVGKFWQITLTANAGKPLAGVALQAAVRAAVGRLNEALATDQPKIDSAEIARQMQGLVFDASEGSSIVMKFRQPPGLGIRSTHLQYVRVLNNQNAGLNLSVTVPTHVGLFTPGISHTDAAQGFEGEIMGSDLSYLMLQHPKLAALLDHPDAATPEGLAALFDANPRVRNGYFATASTIVDTVRRYADFLDAKAQAAQGGTPLANAPKTNEFFRYYASAPFQRVAETARQVLRHAPGSTAALAPAAGSASLAEEVSLAGVDLAAAQARLEGARSIRERTAYLCGEGRPLLDAFAAIVGRTREINASAMFHAESRDIGFQTVLRG